MLPEGIGGGVGRDEFGMAGAWPWLFSRCSALPYRSDSAWRKGMLSVRRNAIERTKKQTILVVRCIGKYIDSWKCAEKVGMRINKRTSFNQSSAALRPSRLSRPPKNLALILSWDALSAVRLNHDCKILFKRRSPCY